MTFCVKTDDARSGDLISQGQVHLRLNQWSEAVQCFRAVTELDPKSFEALGQLGMLLNQLGELDESLVCLMRAAELRPRFPRLNLLIGAVLKKQRKFDAAATYCRREIKLDPRNADAQYNLGLVLQCLDQPSAAGEAYRNALRLRPGYVDALIGLGTVLRETSATREASNLFEQAICRAPHNAEAHWELATTLLLLGDFGRGWKELEWRWQLKDFRTPRPEYAQPRWAGQRLEGKTILLHAEQGFGDTIQFARYASLVAKRGAKVMIGCPQPLHSLMRTVSGVTEVTTHRTTPPPFDFHVPLMSLPAIFQTSVHNVPAQIPYVSTPAVDFRLPSRGTNSLRIGLAWAGDPSHANDRRRSIPLEAFRPLIEQGGIEWYSLQVGPRLAELARSGLDQFVTEIGSRFRDFGDTAQAIQQLDLILSVDTAVAHLAGAMAKRVWTLLPHAPEWRWMLGRSDSPWYPTMRLFRQLSPDDWPSLIKVVHRELKKWLSENTIH